MKAILGLVVRHRVSHKVHEITQIHPYMREIQLKCLPDTHWDFEEKKAEFIGSVDDYQAEVSNGVFEDLDGFEITTEDYIVV